jgi:hypothetical protein
MLQQTAFRHLKINHTKELLLLVVIEEEQLRVRQNEVSFLIIEVNNLTSHP